MAGRVIRGRQGRMACALAVPRLLIQGGDIKMVCEAVI